MPEDNVLVIVDVGLRVGQPLGDAATTLPFQREEVDTERVMRVAAIDDEPAAELAEPMIPITLAAGIDLVAIDRTPARAPAPPRARLGTMLLAVALLAGALGTGIGLAFLIAAIAR